MPLHIPPVIRKILSALGVQDDYQIEQYLSPRLEHLPAPDKMKGLKEAVSLVLAELEQEAEIVIWGDYDVDGTTGTALLVNFFRELSVEPHWHIPNRLTEGYGLNAENFRKLHTDRLAGKRFLLITVDCGISNGDEVAEILALGGQVIVTDHHQLPIGNLPGCIILNPNQDGCEFRNHKLAGVGVAFYLAAGLRQALEDKGYFSSSPKPCMKDYLGFVALGTIADLVSITTTNRILVRAGLESLSRPKVVGLRSLVESAGLLGHPLTTEDISFSLGPKINAAGRLGSAEVAVKLMTCDNIIDGARFSDTLEQFNNKRKELCENNLETALTLLGNRLYENNNTTIVVGDFHVGIIGIVASKLVDIYRKPAIVFANTGTPAEGASRLLKGSGRSIPGVDLLACLNDCGCFILRHGGHSMAAGLTIEKGSLENFSRNFDLAVALQKLNTSHSEAGRPAMVECCLDDIMDEKALALLQRLEPFGPENERPVFVDEAATIVSARAIGGNGQHLQLVLRGKYINYRGVGFGLGSMRNDILSNPLRKIVFTPMINRFKGTSEWQLRVIEV